MQRINTRQIGEKQETFVCEWLEQRGYRIVARNFRCRSGEIDIVAREGGYLVFIEVKYRRGAECGLPEEAVDRKKQRAVSRVALHFMARFGYGADTPVRFDVAAVSGGKDAPVRLYRNAFDFCG